MLGAWLLGVQLSAHAALAYAGLACGRQLLIADRRAHALLDRARAFFLHSFARPHGLGTRLSNLPVERLGAAFSCQLLVAGHLPNGLFDFPDELILFAARALCVLTHRLAPVQRSGLSAAMFLSAPTYATCLPRSEERRVGKECRSRWSPYH